MKRIMRETDQVNFIGEWNVPNDRLFDDLVNFFEDNKHLHKKGVIGGNKNLNLEKKKTTEISIDPIKLKNQQYYIFKEYFDELLKCYNDYKEQWPFLKGKFKSLDIPSFNLQRYLPGDHFSQMHSERISTPTMHRVFAWMTYLNDVKVEDGGCTEFMHYNIKINPEKGKTLIWPAEWTHAHAGQILKRHKKYIITGWMCFSFN